ncbi:disulfide bond formation protein B [Noviherbaspirillum sp. ST9]|uniref:disulfide bond formation protein B n=1 Tax=Noviherbaspirillum sp. ST9 TaxID=3401606 RepID=UPI003B58B145
MNKIETGRPAFGRLNSGRGTHENIWALVFVAWLVAASSSLGALFLGEVMGFAPCVLCWYQRIFMFPLAFVLAVGLFPLDVKGVRYALPLSIAGWLVAVYHLLLIEGVIPETMTPCRQGVPCSQVEVEWLGFVTIPLLSVAAFSVINALLITTYLKTRK